MEEVFGLTGSFAFYYPVKDLFFVGDLNQMGNAALPIRLSMKLAMMTK
jgi:D-alanyl-D-alanine carboxypeptidase